MKKLMTVLASAATALFAFGETLTGPQGVNFEAYSAGAVFDAQKDDAGVSTGDKFWYSTASAGEIGDISNSTASVDKALIPDFFNPNKADSLPIGNYLHIDASASLFRTAVANIQGAESQEDFFSPTNKFVTPVDIGDGIYLDTLVQFTAADDEFQTNLDSGDKIAISYVEHEDDATTEGVNEAWTNFVIRAGQIVQGVLVQKNYFAAVPAGFNKEDWHRLTVRTINISATQVGFIIYLDGDMNKALAYPTTVDAGFGELSGVAATYYNANLHALYPSAVDNTDGSFNKISAASFSGTGALDDVVFTATKPGFIQEAQTVTIVWDEHVASVTINSVAVTAEELAARSKVIDYVGTVLVSATFAEGYEADYSKYTVEPPSAGEWDSTTGGFVNLQPNATCTIASMQPKFDVNGAHYESLSEAIAAALVTEGDDYRTLKLLVDYDGDIELSVAGNITIDLAGKDITGTEYGINNSAANLIITNSTSTIGHVTGNVGAVYIAGGHTSIYGGIFDKNVAYDTEEEHALVLFGGQYLNCPDDPQDTSFYLSDYVDTSVSATAIEDNYFQVGEGGDQPTTLTLTITDNANAEYSVTINDEAAETGAEIKADDVIVITATAKSGYEYATAPEGWTLSEGVITKSITVADASVAVTIPAPTAVVIGTYTVTVTPNANATYTAAYKGGDAITPENDVLTVTVGQTIVITATPGSNYEYAEAPTGWTAGQDGEITIEVSEAGTVEIPAPTAKQQGGYPTYIGDDTAKQKKYDSWKETYGDDTASAYEDAFLLNCAPADVNTEKAAFKFTKIAFENGVWVTETTTKNTANADYNGTVEVKRYSDVKCTTESETGTFFKAILK